MRIACPSCAAAYEVPDPLIKPGRRTRCARCGHQWVAVPLEADLPPPVPLDPHPPAEAEGDSSDTDALPPRRTIAAPTETAPARSGWALRAAWAASVLLLIVLGAAAVIGRQAVMAAWPPATRLYATFGLTDAPRESAPVHGAPAGTVHAPSPAPTPPGKGH